MRLLEKKLKSTEFQLKELLNKKHILHFIVTDLYQAQG